MDQKHNISIPINEGLEFSTSTAKKDQTSQYIKQQSDHKVEKNQERNTPSSKSGK